MEQERLEGDRAATADGLRRAKEAAEASLHAKTARETELATARIELEWKSNNLQARERELAGLIGAPRVADGSRGSAGRIHGSRAHGAGAGERPRRTAGIGGRLPRRRAEVRARGRGLPRRSAPARHRADARTGAGRARPDSPGKRRPLRIRRARGRPTDRRQPSAGDVVRGAGRSDRHLRFGRRITGAHAGAIDAVMPDGFIADDLARRVARVRIDVGAASRR